MGAEHAVIVGASHAAAQLGASLRQGGWEGKISIVGEEALPPYHRPPLSKAYLAGEKHSDEMLIRPAAFYARSGIDLVLGTRVTALDRANKVLTLHDGGTIPYTRLALATGARVRKLALPGHDLGLHPTPVDFHGQAIHRRTIGKLQRKPSFALAVFGVAKGHA